ncbi:MAG: hypothetical protein H0S80_11270, partial [Desulfovibrionaceae bacterium]|nr:hypothetical protein [Desulfovibrionaceae bacterium]
MYEHTQPENYWYTAVYDELIWAVVYPLKDNSSLILFLDKNGCIFESLGYPSWDKTIEAMFINGFTKYADDEAKQRLTPPAPPFKEMNTLNELMTFFKESWIEPTIEDGTSPKTDWDSRYTNKSLPTLLKKYSAALKYILWTMALMLGISGYAYFTEPDGIVVNTEGKIAGNFNKIREVVQGAKFWEVQLLAVNKSIATNQEAISTGNYKNDFDTLVTIEDDDESFSLDELEKSMEKVIFGEHYKTILNDPAIHSLRSEAKQLHAKASALEYEARQIAMRKFNELSTTKLISNLQKIKTHCASPHPLDHISALLRWSP